MVLIHVVDSPGLFISTERVLFQEGIPFKPVNFAEAADKADPVKLQIIKIKIVGFVVIPAHPESNDNNVASYPYHQILSASASPR